MCSFSLQAVERASLCRSQADRASLRGSQANRASLRRNQADRASLRSESMGRASLRGKRWNGLVFVTIWIVLVFVRSVDMMAECSINQIFVYEPF